MQDDRFQPLRKSGRASHCLAGWQMLPTAYSSGTSAALDAVDNHHDHDTAPTTQAASVAGYYVAEAG